MGRYISVVTGIGRYGNQEADHYRGRHPRGLVSVACSRPLDSIPQRLLLLLNARLVNNKPCLILHLMKEHADLACITKT